MVKMSDDVSISVREWGNPNGLEILFVHGYSQSQLSFIKQTRSDLTKTFRMVTYDLRGHGESDKPTGPSDSKRWADDLQEIIDGAKLKKPVLAGWSLGGRIVANYLSVYGDSLLSGINFIGVRIIVDPKRNMLGPGAQFVAPMQSPDLETNIAATANFVRTLVYKPLRREDFEFMLAYNMVVPYYARAAAQNWPSDFVAALTKITVPVLVTHGKADQCVLPFSAEFTANNIKTARISWYEGVGHSPFWEEPERFNKELAEFVTDVQNR